MGYNFNSNIVYIELLPSRKPSFAVPSLWSEIVHSIALHHSVFFVL